MKEKPDSVLPTLGGQTGLNLAMELAEDGFLKQQGVRLLGTSVQAIKMAEDRQEFKDTMERINEPVIASKVGGLIESVGDAGILVDDFVDPKAWTVEIRKVLNDKKLYMSLSKKSFRQSQKFKFEIGFSKLVKILNSVHRP